MVGRVSASRRTVGYIHLKSAANTTHDLAFDRYLAIQQERGLSTRSALRRANLLSTAGYSRGAVRA